MTAASHEEQNPAYRSTSAQPKAGRDKNLAAGATWQMLDGPIQPLISQTQVFKLRPVARWRRGAEVDR